MAKELTVEWVEKKLQKVADRVEKVLNNDSTKVAVHELSQMAHMATSLGQELTRVAKVKVNVEARSKAMHNFKDKVREILEAHNINPDSVKEEHETEAVFREDDDKSFIEGTTYKAEMEGVELTKEYADKMRPSYEEAKKAFESFKELLS